MEAERSVLDGTEVETTVYLDGTAPRPSLLQMMGRPAIHSCLSAMRAFNGPQDHVLHRTCTDSAADTLALLSPRGLDETTSAIVPPPPPGMSASDRSHSQLL